MWRSHKARRQTFWEASSRLPVAWAWCRTRGIKNGSNLVQSLFLIPLTMEEIPLFSSSILYQCIWAIASRWIHSRIVSVSISALQRKAHSTCGVCAVSTHLQPVSVAQRFIQLSLQTPGKECHSTLLCKGPTFLQNFLSAIPFIQPAVQLKLFFHMFFHLCSYWKKAKQMKLTCFPQIERWLTNTSSCQAGAHLKDDTSIERSCYCCILFHIFSIFPCD